MPDIRSIRLFLWLPLMIIITVLVVESIGLVIAYRDTQEQIWDNQRQLSRQIVEQLRSILSNRTDAAESDTIKDVLAQYSVDPHIKHLLLLNSERKVLLSNRLSEEGQMINQASMSWLDPVSLNLALTGREEIQEDQAAGRIHYYLGLPMGTEQGSLRRIKTGALVLEYSLRRDLNAAFGTTARNHAYVPFLLVLLAFIIMIIIHWYLVRPLEQIIQASTQLGQGDLKQRLTVSGRGELAELSHSFNQMTERLESSWNTLQEREKFLQITLKSIGDAVIVTDQQGRVIQLNPVAEKLTAWTQDEAVGKKLEEIFLIYNAITGEKAENPVEQVLREGKVVGLANNTMLHAKHGAKFQIADSAAPIRLHENSPLLGVILVFRDVTEAYQLHQKLQDQLDQLESITRALPDLTFILSEDGTYLDILGGDEALLYKQRKELLGKSLNDILPENTATEIMRTIQATILSGKTQSLEFCLPLEIGEHWFEGRTAPLSTLFDGMKAVVWISRDITQNKQNEEKIYQLAYYDELTGLLNRSAFIERLEQAMAHCHRQHTYGALLFIDLDHFKDVNDSLGHDIGDELLKLVGQRCRDILRIEDILSRMAGDEFVIFLSDLGNSEEIAATDARIVAEKLIQELEHPFTLDDHYLRVSASTGITLYPQQEALDNSALMKQADTAMYRAKSEGRGCISFFAKEDQLQAERRFKIIQDLPRSLEKGEIQLYLQPIVDEMGVCHRAEALMRWQHRELSWISPEEFIPIAESTGMILKLGSWSIQEGARLYSLIRQQQGESRFSSIAINLSPAQFQQPDFVDLVLDTLRRYKMPAKALELELTEEILISKPELVKDSLSRLRNKGVHFSIDDFGSGYSSLQYLTQLPIDTLKVDRSLIRDIQEDSKDAAIVDAVIQMANSLDLHVIAEGVETQAQFEFLKERRCHFHQGYYFAKPMPLEAFLGFLKNQRANDA